MREILFRGRRLDNGEWVEGYGVVQNIEDGESHIKSDGAWVEVDPATVGQFVGREDKHGKRIFTGDVVENVTFKDCFERVGNTYYSIRRYRSNTTVVRYDTHWCQYILTDGVEHGKLEVIGTIHETEAP